MASANGARQALSEDQALKHSWLPAGTLAAQPAVAKLCRETFRDYTCNKSRNHENLIFLEQSHGQTTRETWVRTQRGGFVFGVRDLLWVSVGQYFIFGALCPSKSGLMNKHIVKTYRALGETGTGNRRRPCWKQEASLQACPLHVSLRLDTTLSPADSKVKSAVFPHRFGQDVSPVPRVALAGCYEPTC